MHVLCVYVLKLLSGIFCFFGTRSGFFGKDRLATLSCCTHLWSLCIMSTYLGFDFSTQQVRIKWK